MNDTNYEHILSGVVIQTVLAFLITFLGFQYGFCGGAIAATAFFYGREYAQVEYKFAKKLGIGLADVSPKYPLDFRNWSKDGLLDLFPTVSVVWSIAIYIDFYQSI